MGMLQEFDLQPEQLSPPIEPVELPPLRRQTSSVKLTSGEDVPVIVYRERIPFLDGMLEGHGRKVQTDSSSESVQ